MNKFFKKFTALFLALTMMLCAVPAYAGVRVSMPKSKVVSIHPQRKDNKAEFIGGVTGTSKVSVSAGNKSILTVSKIRYTDGITRIFATPKKTGTTNIYTKVGSKTYKTKVTVKKYANPVKYVKIGKTNLTTKNFAKSPVCNTSYKKLANKHYKVNVRLNKGWKIGKIMYVPCGWDYADLISNGQTFKFYGGKNSKLMIECIGKGGIKENITVKLV